MKYLLLFVATISIPCTANNKPKKNIINIPLRPEDWLRMFLTVNNIVVIVSRTRKNKNGCLLFQRLIIQITLTKQFLYPIWVLLYNKVCTSIFHSPTSKPDFPPLNELSPIAC